MAADPWTLVGGHRLRDVPRSRPEWVWPAAEWAAHLESCPRGKRCDHRLQLPDWWAVVMASSTGSREHEDAVRRKIVAVGHYRPSVPLTESGLRFARETVMNALALAPDPLSESWVRMTLASVSGLVAFCESYGVPLASEAVFDEATVDRYLMSRTDVSDNTRYQMKGRLLRLKRFMVPVSAPAYASDTGRGYLAVPMSVEQENYLWHDSQRLSAETRRRVRVVYGLGLGCGLTAKEIASIKGDAVRVTEHGVEVAVGRRGEVTWIPCRRLWEDRLWDEIRDLDTTVYLYSGTSAPLGSRGISALLARAQREGQWACNTHEMRNTWLVRLLDAELPLFTILELSGMRNPHHLYRLRDHVAAVPLSRYDERVREA